MEMDPDSPNSREGEYSVIGSAGGVSLEKSESATNAGSSSSKIKMRRHRVVLSCKPCHMHKQKCDRQMPCSRCIKRGDPAFCMYENPPAGSSAVMRSSPRENNDLALRVAQLESLVQASLGGQTQVPQNIQTPSSVPSHASESAVQVAAAALGELSQQQDRMQDVEENRIAKTSSYLNVLPQRALVEELLTFFFDYSSFPFLWHVVHRRFFDRSYVAFTSHPESVSADFIALLCAVCSSALQLMPESNQASPLLPKDASERQTLKSRVLSFARSTLTSESSQPHSIERIQGLMVLSIYYFNEGNFWSSYNLIGMAVRGAQFVGMHRDPTVLWPHILPDEVEVRRRLWAGLCVLDRKLSFVLKRPYIIQEIHCTIKPPANSDDEITTVGAGVIVKPLSELTDHTFHILQLNLTKITRRLTDECFGNAQPSYSTVLSIERETLRFEERIPQAFVLAVSPDFAKEAQQAAQRLQALYLSMDVCHIRLTLMRYFAFLPSSLDAESSRSKTKEQGNISIFESSARTLCEMNCKKLISIVTIALNDWKKEVSQHLRWSMLVLYIFDAALPLTLCALKRFGMPSHDAFTWLSLAASVLRDLGTFVNTPMAKNALTLVETLLQKLEEEISPTLNGAHLASYLSASEGLELAKQTLREEQPSMDELLKACKDSEALWLTTMASVYEVYYPGPEAISTLDLPGFKHFLNSCISR